MVIMGRLEDAVRNDVAALGELTGVQRSFAETALLLARGLDNGARGMGAAALARELRVTLDELMEAADRGDAASDIVRSLSTPVRDASDSGEGNSRSKGRRRSARAGASVDALAAGRTRRSARG